MFTNDFAAEDFASTGTDGLTADQLVSTNWQTTAAVGLTVASGGVLGALSLAAFPAQTLAAGTGIGVLAYAGKRRADGKAPLPFIDQIGKGDSKKSDKKSDNKSDDKSDN